MAQELRRIDPLIFDDNIADNWRKFEKEWRIYCFAGLSDKSKKVQAYTLLNLAGSEAIDKAETFVYADGEDREDPEVLLAKFSEVCLPAKNLIMDRYAFNTAVQKPGESVQAYVSTLKILARKCEFGSLQDELIRDRIVCGIQNDIVRKHLLREKNLTLDLAVNMCLLQEGVDTGAKCNVISKRILNSSTIDHTIPINTTERVNLVAYEGETINTVRTAVLHCFRGHFKFHVVDQD